MPLDVESSDIVGIRYADVGTAFPSIYGTTPPIAWPTSPGAAQNERQSVTLTGSPDGGDFTLTSPAELGAQETGAIPYDATASEVEEALEALSGIGEGGVKVTGNSGGPWTVEFIGVHAKKALSNMTKNASGLTGGTTPNVSIAETQAGSAGGGIWTPVPTVDSEKTTKITWDAQKRNVRTAGAARPVRGHMLALAPATIEFTTTESGIDALRFIFPNFEYDASNHWLNLRVKSKQTIYKAIALETPIGCFEFKKCSPKQDSELSMIITDITEPVVVLDTYEDNNGNVGFFHVFED